MKTIPSTVVIVLGLFFDHSIAAGNLENTLTNCCNVGKSWSTEKKSCNITLSFPMFNVATEHNEMCLNTVGACCLDTLREIRCNEGKQIALENETCSEKIQQGKNQVDSMMCCEICKIGITVGSTKTMCGSTPLLFGNHQWGEVYQSCCSAPKVKSIPTGIKKNHNIAGPNRCNDGTHDCSPKEKCVSTRYGFECHPRLQLPFPLSMTPENLTRKKPNCAAGHAYDVTEQRCKDIDECVQQPCDINEQCQNTVGSFKCLCKKGFQLDNVTNACTDINECQLNLHTCHETQRCDNTVGSYQCVRFTGCGTGYTLDVESSLCKDDDECALKTDTCRDMGAEWVCRNTLGSFRCEKKRCTGPNCGVRSGLSGSYQSVVKCLRGYEVDRNNKCIDINECSSPTRCLKNEVCYNTNGSYYCLPKSKQFPR